MASSFIRDVVGELSLAQAVLGATGLSLLWYIVSSVVVWSRLRHVPGPFFASFSNMWCFWNSYGGNGHISLAAEHKKRGGIVRIGPDAVATSDPEALLRIHSARSTYTRGPWYAAARLDPSGENIINELDVTKHGKRKAKLATAFTGKNVSILENKIDEWIAALIGTLRDKIAKGEENMDIGMLIQYFQVDLVSDIEMGKPWGNLHENKDHFDYLKLNEWILPLAQSLGFFPLARKFFVSQFFSDYIGPKASDTKGLGQYLKVIQNEVENRFNSGDEALKEKSDILSIWVRNGLSAKECRLDLSLLIPAGAETSIMMIRGTLLLLMTSPAAYRKVKQEIKEGIAVGRISDPITNEEGKHLEYMQAVILEGLRLMAPITFGFPKRVPAPGDTVCGKFLPEGTDVYPNFYSMMHRADVFGDDVGLFRPERFLGGGPDVALRTKIVDLGFGGGRFVCLGKTMAYIEINKIFVELLRHFDFQVASPEKPWRRTSYSSWLLHDFWARVTEDPTMA